MVLGPKGTKAMAAQLLPPLLSAPRFQASILPTPLPAYHPHLPGLPR